MPMSDEELLDAWTTIRDNLVLRIGELSASHKPTYEIDGQKVEWGAYLKQLREQLLAAEEMLRKLEGPYEFETQGYL